jgi:BirA family transcriptional regulator, biotin operon repressor / biotin---[acetyl-CoA-carboxylase] ligase
LNSNRSDPGGAQAAPLTPELADALAIAMPRLGRLATSVIYCPTVGSTNDVAVMLAARGACEGAVVVADAQTAGRGRRGREWFSPSGSGLYVSVVLTPGRARDERAARATRLVTLAAGVALAEAVATATGLGVDVKWPNDLYVAGRKLAGILAEAAGGPDAEEAVVLGYGINVGATAYPRELRDRATSIESELGRAVDRALLFAESLAAVARRYDDLLAGRFDVILDAWRARSPGSNGARVAWTTASGELTGITAGIDGEGALLVRAGDRLERIVAGEVRWF